MNSDQIHSALERTIHPPVHFLGVFPRDRLPSIHSYPSCYVANTDDSSKPGTHWVAFYFENIYNKEFFDSYGFTPSVYGFNISANIRNPIQLQSLTSTVCGQYCIFYLIQRSSGFPMYNLITCFSRTNPIWNDHHVARYAKKYFSVSNHAERLECTQTCIARNHALCSL